MSKLCSIILFTIFLISCQQKVELKKYDDNGNLIVYSEEVYAKIWTKNKDLKVTVIDTFCANQKIKAINDIKKGKLIYFGFHPREFKRMSEILKKYGIETKEHLSRCVRLGGFEPYCYQEEMQNEINRKYGENFIDSIFKVAQKEFTLKNPNVVYMEDGIDLRKKMLEENQAIAASRYGLIFFASTLFFTQKVYISRRFTVCWNRHHDSL